MLDPELLERITARRAELDELVRSFPLCGSELEEFWNAWGVLVGLESGQKGVDKLHAARCSDASCQEQGFGAAAAAGSGWPSAYSLMVMAMGMCMGAADVDVGLGR
ncbi:hypothetical protein ACIA8I_19610 [Streptomyces rishiriensis]|uniref:hypothetical protein n=1 Tax=Streptomyces rishiriensis TaxID=68264 RepID=UPI0037B0985A